jgi:Skp family chaperone for outer membrane proteins
MMKKSIIAALVLALLLLSSCAAPPGVSWEEYARVGAEFEAAQAQTRSLENELEAAQAQIRTLENELEVVREELERAEKPEIVTEQIAIDKVEARLFGLAQSDGAEDYLNSFNEWVAWNAKYLEATEEFELGHWRVWVAHGEELTPERERELKEQGYWFSGFGLDGWRRFAPPGYPHWGYASWMVFDNGIVMPQVPATNCESSECAMRVEWDLMWLSAGMSGTYPMELVKLTDITE